MPVVTEKELVEGAKFWCIKFSLEAEAYGDVIIPAFPWEGKVHRVGGMTAHISHFDHETGVIDEDSNATSFIDLRYDDLFHSFEDAKAAYVIEMLASLARQVSTIERTLKFLPKVIACTDYDIALTIEAPR